MKRTFLTTVLLVLCIGGIMSILHTKKSFFVYGKGPKFEILKELPPYFIESGQHVNFGVAYGQLSLYWIPLWNYTDPQYVLVTDNKKIAYELNDEDLQYIDEEFGIDTSVLPFASFWDRIGGKLIIGAFCLLLLMLVYFYLRRKRKKSKEVLFIPNQEIQPEITAIPVGIPLKGKRNIRGPIGFNRTVRQGIRSKRALKQGIKQKRNGY